jgi:hypothetical protein
MREGKSSWNLKHQEGASLKICKIKNQAVMSLAAEPSTQGPGPALEWGAASAASRRAATAGAVPRWVRVFQVGSNLRMPRTRLTATKK